MFFQRYDVERACATPSAPAVHVRGDVNTARLPVDLSDATPELHASVTRRAHLQDLVRGARDVERFTFAEFAMLHRDVTACNRFAIAQQTLKQRRESRWNEFSE